ncbi:MAG: hypothetical protein DHS20C15_17220 [Planctomycetota bacterium]|nr:MAG: hypothetical protein DHS20C15_17220 [Planctomycetota bacterium]
MKKLLIGCGIVAVLLLGALGYIGWKLAPAVQQLMNAGDALQESFVELNVRYPYDPEVETDFSVDRFQTALELRSELRVTLAGVAQSFEEIEKGELGFFESVEAAFTAVTEPFEKSSQLLDQARMSPVEFTQHVLAYWAAAKSAHDGLGDQQALASLRANYELFAQTYAKAREDSEDIPRLATLLEDVAPDQIAGAREYLEMNHDLAELGEAELVLELVMVQLSNPETGFAQLQGSNGNMSGSIRFNPGNGTDEDP